MRKIWNSLNLSMDQSLWGTSRGSFKSLFAFRLIVFLIAGTMFTLDNMRIQYSQLLIYLTTWGFLSVFSFYITAFLDLILQSFTKYSIINKIRTALSKLAKLLFCNTFGLQAPITFVYWLLFWRFYYDLFPQWWVQFYVVLNHGGYLMITWIEFKLNDLQLKRIQILIPLIAYAIYSAYNYGSYILEGFMIYPIDYKKFELVLLAGGLGLIILPIHFELGVCLSKKYKAKPEDLPIRLPKPSETSVTGP
eukprot:TRINITY_DN2425_c0_g1_i3.p1 TRINITY_DN2425_c0_g1~~TRINITY_DN2425_c0_g1_i3.p1  ORF type:complete len:249 (-),score=11.74 TRINITY_DN2425_c0_g1_i3:61-807(-)